MPCPRSDGVGDQGREGSIEVEEEEDGEDAGDGDEDEEFIVESRLELFPCLESMDEPQRGRVHVDRHGTALEAVGKARDVTWIVTGTL